MHLIVRLYELHQGELGWAATHSLLAPPPFVRCSTAETCMKKCICMYIYCFLYIYIHFSLFSIMVLYILFVGCLLLLLCGTLTFVLVQLKRQVHRDGACV